MPGQSDNAYISDKKSANAKDRETSFSVSTAPCIAGDDDSSAAQGTTTAAVKCYVPPCGLVLYVLAFFSLTCTFGLRTSLSVAIVAMVNQSAVTQDEVTTNVSDTDRCPRDPALDIGSGEFNWNRHEQAAVLAAFYYSHIFTKIPGGWLADRFGGKWLCGGCVLLSSVISLLTPSAARFHLGVFLLLRILSGLGEGAHFPAIHALIARWSAPRYRSLVVASIFTGANAGVVVGMLLSGVLCDHGFAGGWPSVFYVFGMIGCVWSVAWFLLCYNSPSTHPRISTSEREYWERMIGATELVTRPPTPWRKLFTSLPVWALAVAFFAVDWGFYTLAICIPMFMHDVLGFDMTKNGALSAVTFLPAGLLIPVGWLADWLRSPGKLSTNLVRKMFIASGFILTGSLLIVIGYTGCNHAATVVVMFIVFVGMCISFPMIVVNQLDLSPLHAGRIMGLTYAVASLSPIAAPHVVGALTYHRSTRSEWQNVFFLAAGIHAVATVLFVIFGSGKRLQWVERPEVHSIPATQQPYAAAVQQTDAITDDVQGRNAQQQSDNAAVPESHAVTEQ